MTPTRRQFLEIAGTTIAATGALGTAAKARRAGGKIKAVGFDAFTIFDPRSVMTVVEDNFPGRGQELMESLFKMNTINLASRIA